MFDCSLLASKLVKIGDLTSIKDKFLPSWNVSKISCVSLSMYFVFPFNTHDSYAPSNTFSCKLAPLSSDPISLIDCDVVISALYSSTSIFALTSSQRFSKGDNVAKSDSLANTSNESCLFCLSCTIVIVSPCLIAVVDGRFLI